MTPSQTPAPTTADLPDRGPLRIFERWALRGTVESVTPVTRRMRHVVVTGEDLVGRDWTPGQNVRVMFRDATQLRILRSMLSPREAGDLARTYSLWDYDPAAGRYELVVLDHGGDAPGARWVRGVRAGDAVLVAAPEGRYRARVPSPYHLFVGEETAAVCFGAMLRALPAGERVHGILEAETADDQLVVPRGDELRRVERHGASASPSGVLVEALRSLDLPDEPGTAYLAGEAKTIQAVRRHLIDDRGWSRTSILTKPFWTPGKRGMD
ncbi:siderophore-interacting protein [Patulibacter sp. S7RM1-6]